MPSPLSLAAGRARLSRLAKRQSRQRKRSGRLNRLYTDPETSGEISGSGPATTQPADDWRSSLPEHVFLPASAPEHALTPKELALYNFVREPPPPTIYIRGALQALLRAHPRRSLVIDCDEPSPVINVEEDAPPSRPASGDQAGPTDEREDPCSYTAGDITIKSRLLCAREREYQHLDDDSSASQRETGAGSSTDKPRPRQTSGDKPRPDSTNAEIAPTSATDPDTEQIIVLPSGKAYQKPKPVPKGRSKLPDRASAQPMEAGPPSELQVEDVTAGTAPARAQAAAGPQLKTGTSEEDPLLDAPPSSRTPAAAAPLEVSDSQLPPAASAASGAEPAAVSGQGARLRLYRPRMKSIWLADEDEAVKRLQIIQRAIAKEARARKKQALTNFLNEIDTPEYSNRMSRLFKAVKRFAPKTKKQRIQLKDELGHLLTPSDAAQAYSTFFHELYQSPAVPPDVGVLTEDLGLSWAEWFSALAQTQARKAVPSHYAPALLWKHCADLLAHFIAPRASFPAGPIEWPETWTDAFLALLPKPPKPPSHPKALRPISLLDPLSKLRTAMCRYWLAEASGKVVTCAFSEPPSLAVLQVARFQGAGKYQGLVSCQSHILLPVFRDDSHVDVDRMPYSLQAACIHVGDQATTGHYRALLWDEGNGRFLLSDDGQCVDVLSMSAANELLSRYCYLLFYLRSTHR
eukprot:s759_g7.t3